MWSTGRKEQALFRVFRVFRGRLTRARRSWNMSRIRGKNTAPEKIVRSLLHQIGFRFRLHVHPNWELGMQFWPK
jgi:hypothetical protein